MTVTCMLIHGVTGLFLTLALNYQRKFRSGGSPVEPIEKPTSTTAPAKPVDNDLYDDEQQYDDEDSAPEQEQHTLITNESKSPKRVLATIAHYLFSFEMLALICLSLFFLSTYLRASNWGVGNAEAYKWFQFSTVILQRIPILIIALMIIFSKRSSSPSGGPSIFSRFVLVLALILNLPNDMSITYWYMFLGSANTCVFHIASIYDMILLFYLFSLVLWFLFMRMEFVRNQEDIMFAAVQHSQQGSQQFDFQSY